MKPLMLVAAVVAVCLPATTVATAAPPASLPDGPDLSLMALAPGDFAGGGRVAKQRYTSARGVLAAYERDLTLRGRLLFATNNLTLFRTASAAQQDAASLRRALATARGRAAVGRAFAKALAPLRVRSTAVTRPVGISAGNYAFRFGIRLTTNAGRLHVGFGVVRVDRVSGLVTVVARPGRTVPNTQMVRLARSQATRFRAGFTITSVTAPSIAGTPAVGQTVTAERGRWTGGPTELTYQWARCDASGSDCLDLAGSTGSTYTVTAADAGATLRVRVRARNAISELTVDSPASATVLP